MNARHEAQIWRSKEGLSHPSKTPAAWETLVTARYGTTRPAVLTLAHGPVPGGPKAQTTCIQQAIASTGPMVSKTKSQKRKCRRKCAAKMMQASIVRQFFVGCVGGCHRELRGRGTEKKNNLGLQLRLTDGVRAEIATAKGEHIQGFARGCRDLRPRQRAIASLTRAGTREDAGRRLMRDGSCVEPRRSLLDKGNPNPPHTLHAPPPSGSYRSLRNRPFLPCTLVEMRCEWASRGEDSPE
ncbi:hypothetical protein BD289DRAFT_248910 [Coniella lustricola]|uniref:Uncharacterized protein n=1 Tax=Coniella lustricola TaxID=2025994 RepID=A0A2T3A8V4_9PEZI|nr:hypothetical protein BD289DRAFT_248910 [Coniella lustricola]